MSYFLCKSILLRRYGLKLNDLGVKWFSSSSVRVSPEKRSFTVSYLMNSFGFSLEASKAISKYVGFQTSHKPDKAVDFLRNFGFSQTQIPRLVRVFPQILIMNVERTILPKLEFLESKGISRPELVKSLSSCPSVLCSSLDNLIIPRFECLKALLPSEVKIARIIEQCPDILRLDIEKYLSPNVSTLRSYGVPDSNIVRLISNHTLIYLNGRVWSRETVEEVAEMGFDPARVSFTIAVCARVNKSLWESKVGHYKKFGWSESDISRAFVKYPWCMMASKDKITSVMDFFVREMGLKPTELANYPVLFNHSLRKRIVPRVRVFKALTLKGLLKEQCTLYTLFLPTEKKFIQRYVTPYENVVPELMQVYKDEKSDLSSQL